MFIIRNCTSENVTVRLLRRNCILQFRKANRICITLTLKKNITNRQLSHFRILFSTFRYKYIYNKLLNILQLACYLVKTLDSMLFYTIFDSLI